MIAKAEELAYLVFEKPELAHAEFAFTALGLISVARTASNLYLRARGSAAYCVEVRRGPRARFVGFGVRVGSAAEVDQLAAISGSRIEPVAGPGGGTRVRLCTPDRIEVDAVHGAHASPELPIGVPAASNNFGLRMRVNGSRRVTRGPAPVTRLGHVAIRTPRLEATLAWLRAMFGMIVSDYEVLSARDNEPVVAFLRCDRGAIPTDHHSIALVCAPKLGFEHAAFEVPDLDAVAAGGETLRSAGWSHAWGIGRHLLGSQIFDYWRDPDGMMFEHYTDGDVFDASVPTGTIPLTRAAQAQWGPPIPDTFLDTALTAPRLIDAIRSRVGMHKLIAIRRALQR